MTTLPMTASLRTPVPENADLAAVIDPSFRYAFDESCSVLIGWQRRDAVLRMLSPTFAVVGGVVGLRPGDSVRLVLYRDEVLVLDCRVMRTTLQGVELRHGSVSATAGDQTLHLQ